MLKKKNVRGIPTSSWGFAGVSASKESACNAGDLGLIPGLGRSPEVGHGNPFQYMPGESPRT